MSLLFAVSAMSTGGVIAPASKPASFWFCGFYAMVGVPLFGVCIGTLGSMLSEKEEARVLAEKITAKISHSELEFIDRIGTNDGQIDRFEFRIMSFLRIGALDMDLLKVIDSQFDLIDSDDSGAVTNAEVDAVQTFYKYDKDHSGTLCLKEFVLMLCDLRKRLPKLFSDISLKQMPIMFAKLDDSNDGTICREEFLAWWRAHTLKRKANRAGKSLRRSMTALRNMDATRSGQQAASIRNPVSMSKSGEPSQTTPEAMTAKKEKEKAVRSEQKPNQRGPARAQPHAPVATMPGSVPESTGAMPVAVPAGTVPL